MSRMIFIPVVKVSVWDGSVVAGYCTAFFLVGHVFVGYAGCFEGEADEFAATGHFAAPV